MNDEGAPIDCAIVGGGPAGVSAAIWAHGYDLETRWLDRSGRVGGMLDRVENTLQNYPGGLYADGPALSRDLRRQIDESAVAPPEPHDVERLERLEEDRWRVHLREGTSFASRTVVVATGTEYRQLGVPGESRGMGAYVSQSTSRDADRFAGRTVAVVGGGDAGFEGALQLADRNARVHMLLRSDQFRARPQFVEPVRESDSIVIHPIPSLVRRIDEVPGRDTCILEVDRDGRRQTLEVACLFVRIGVDPIFPSIDPEPALDDEGYVRVDRRQQTDVPGLYAAGDVTDALLPAVAVAVGAGATAVHAAAEELGLA